MQEWKAVVSTRVGSASGWEVEDEDEDALVG